MDRLSQECDRLVASADVQSLLARDSAVACEGRVVATVQLHACRDSIVAPIVHMKHRAVRACADVRHDAAPHRGRASGLLPARAPTEYPVAAVRAADKRG